MHKITNLCKFEFNLGRRCCEIIIKERTPLSHEVVCFQMLDFETSKSFSEVSKSNSSKITFFSQKLLQGKVVSHNGLYYQQLPFTRSQVRFYANKYFEQLPVVSTAFKLRGFKIWLITTFSKLKRISRGLYFTGIRDSVWTGLLINT